MDNLSTLRIEESSSSINVHIHYPFRDNYIQLKGGLNK